jgi:phosphoglycolate phosphatase
MTSITIACLDMAGTTVADDGSVLAALSAALDRFGPAPGTPAYAAAMQTVHATMGQSKIEVFRRILGDEVTAWQANGVFEERYADAVAAGQVRALPGAAETITRLSGAGVQVCLLTGFSPATRDAIIGMLGWQPLIDLALSRPTPGAAGPGRTCRSPRCCGWAAARSANWPWSVTRRATSSRGGGPERAWSPAC